MRVVDDFRRKIKSTDAAGKSWRYQYEVNNNLLWSIGAKAQKSA